MDVPADTCPACRAPTEERRGAIAFCASCGHRWLATSAADHHAVEQHVYTRDYAGYRPDPRFVATATDFTRGELMRRVPPPARLLDVGCGAGDFMGVAQGLGYAVEGIDISEASAELCRSRGFTARAGDFLTERFDGSFDLITMWDVVEHLRDPGAFLERARSLLSRDGLLFTKIPGFGDLSVGISSRVPRAAGTLLGAPSHVQFFDRRSLSALLSRTGFAWESVEWGQARSAATGGSLKRRLGRSAGSLVRRLSGDANFYVIARAA